MTGPETEIDDATPESEEKQKLNLEVEVTKPDACTRHVTVTVSQEDVDRYFEEAFTELMPSAEVPGFRAGRAPRKLVEQRFRGQVADQVKGSLLMDSMSQVSEDQEFSAISEPDFDFDAVELPDNGPLKFEFNIEVRPEFDVPQWKGLELERLTRDFSKEDIDRQLQDILRTQAEIAPYEGTVEPGDYVVANIRSRLDGKVLAEASETTVAVKPIASFPDARLEGFEKLMTGAKAGETKTEKCTISHDADNADLQGKDVEVDFEVLEVKRLELPELDQALLERLGGYENEGELRDQIKAELERRLDYQRQRRLRQQITGLLTQSADWELPPDLVKRQASREMERATLEMRSSGFSEEEIKAYEHELQQNSLATTKTALQEHFILEKIAEDEEVDAENDDYDAEIALIAAQGRESPRRVRARIEKKGMMDALRNQIIERKVIELIEKAATFKDVKYEPEKNETVPVDLTLSGLSAANIPEAKHGEEQPLHQPTDRS